MHNRWVGLAMENMADYSDTEDFAKHLEIVQSYLAMLKNEIRSGDDGACHIPGKEGSEELRSLERGTSHGEFLFERVSVLICNQAFQVGSLQAIIEHAMHFSQYLTPGMMRIIQELMEQWQKNGFSLKR
jgi:hypothetical protein